jgi:hypothetical protein
LIEGNRRFDRDETQRPINDHTRWALAAAPVVLTMWAFLRVARLPNRRWVLGIVAVATCVVRSADGQRTHRSLAVRAAANGRRMAAERGLRRSGNYAVPTNAERPDGETAPSRVSAYL